VTPDDLAAWLLLGTFDRLRFVAGEGWQIRPRVFEAATPWRTLAAPEAWVRRVTASAVGDSPDGPVFAALRDDVLLREALDLLALDSHVRVSAPATSVAPVESPAGLSGVVVDLAAARRRRLSRAS
jgi:hypothetical protein